MAEDAPHIRELTIVGVAAGAIFAFSMQPSLPYADPLLMFFAGVLGVLALTAFVMSITGEDVHPLINNAACLMAGVAAVLFGQVAIDANAERTQAKAVCARLEQIMLHEHRRRTDIPAIYAALRCPTGR